MVKYKSGDIVIFRYYDDWFEGKLNLERHVITNLKSDTFKDLSPFATYSFCSLESIDSLSLKIPRIPIMRGFKRRLFKCMSCFKETKQIRFIKNECKYCKEKNVMVEVENI